MLVTQIMVLNAVLGDKCKCKFNLRNMFIDLEVQSSNTFNRLMNSKTGTCVMPSLMHGSFNFNPKTLKYTVTENVCIIKQPALRRFKIYLYYERVQAFRVT